MIEGTNKEIPFGSLTASEIKKLVRDVMKKNYITSIYALVSMISHQVFTDKEYSFNLLEELGGDEGQGEEVLRIFSIEKENKTLGYFKVNGYYNSYEGTDYIEKIIPVMPVEVQCIEFRVYK